MGCEGSSFGGLSTEEFHRQNINGKMHFQHTTPKNNWKHVIFDKLTKIAISSVVYLKFSP